MADPATAMALTGLVGTAIQALKAYMDYRVGVKQADATHGTPPEKTKEAEQGEQAAPIVKAAVAQHGTEREQQALAEFEDDPATYEAPLRKALENIAQRSPAFAQELKVLAAQATIVQPGASVVNIDNQASNYGVQGSNYGTINMGTTPRPDGA